jgi:subtilase family serine protease
MVAGWIAASAATLALLAAPAWASQPFVRIGTAPLPPPGATLLAGAAAVKSMQLTVALQPRDPAALSAYASAVSTAGSPAYRHYLTPSEFRARFAPRRTTLVRVQAQLRRQGLQTTGVMANGLAIRVRGSSAAIEHAFRLSLVRVRLADGRDAVYNSAAPAVPLSVAPDIQAVIGLSSLAVMQRLDITHGQALAAGAAHGGHTRLVPTISGHAAQAATGGPQPCATAADIAPGQGAYTANEIASAYGFSGVYATGDLGQGVTVGVYELESDAPSDIAAYQRCYGTHTQVSYVKVDGGAGTGPGQGEAALDIEQLIGLAPDAKLLVYQGPNNNSDNPGTGPYDTLAAMITQDKVQVITNSWGECEALEGASDAQAENTLLQEAAVQGQTFVSAAGDSGSEDCWTTPPGGDPNNSLAVDDPASQPFATAVGGTTLSQIGPPPAETVWNDDNPDVNYAAFGVQQGAGGGGISSLWQMPAFQSGAPAALGVINANSSGQPCGLAAGSYCREVPDVSANADPMTAYLDYWNGNGSAHGESGWQGTGGTSGAAPLWAALFALADASRACRGTQIGFADPSLYALAAQSQATYFNEITTGNNDFTPTGNTSGLYPASPGYNMASGLGSPKAAALVPALCQQAVSVGDPGAVYTFDHQHVRLRLHAALAAGQSGTLRFHSARLPLGLHLDRATGVISGRVRLPGVRTVTITASSSTGESGTIRFQWAVARLPQVSAVLAGSSQAPALTVHARAGAYEPGLREVVIALPRALRLVGPGAVRVLTPAGRRLAHSARLSGQILTIKLAVVHSPVEVLFPAGSLRPGRAASGLVHVAVRTIDRVGGHVTLRRSVGRA